MSISRSAKVTSSVGNRADVNRWIETLKKCELIPEADVKQLTDKAIEILDKEENVRHVQSPVTVCGDIHGQHKDLIELFEVGGQPPMTNYLFLGDYVDRGPFGVETFLLLLALKVRYPKHITLVRGNHESSEITQLYGFYDECIRKYGSTTVWQMCTKVFNHLNLAAVIDDRVLCLHGGLSPNIEAIDQLDRIQRRLEVPVRGPMSDIMWSDPSEDVQGWASSPRGAGYLFGADTVERFNRANRIDLICRAHQLVMDGYKCMFDDQLVTVWSAPNYTGRCGNIASILNLDETLEPVFSKFNEAPRDEEYEKKMESRKKVVPEYFL